MSAKLGPAVRRFYQLLDRWNSQSLAMQFLLAGGMVSIAAVILVGTFVTSLIEAAVTRHSAATTALYVDSVIAPLLPDMQRSESLDDAVTRALDETLGQGALRNRLLAFVLWRPDGTVLYSNIKGKRLEPSEHVETALAGKMAAEYDRIEGLPVLDIFNPVLQPWSGKVVAVSEFYEIATDLERSLRQARLGSWLAVAAVILGFFLALSAIVFRGSRIIDSQSRTLQDRVAELSDLLAQNRSLQARIRRASQQAAALNESYLRRIGADLHDGPAQLIALAALRLDSSALADPSGEKRRSEISAIKTSLDEAMREIRNICNGLVLPRIETAALPVILARVIRAHEQRTDTKVELTLSNPPQSLSPAAKICVYRVVQEALSNSYRHGGGIGQRITQTYEDGILRIEVADSGPGFDPAMVRPESLGLAGLRQRVESLGGNFSVESSPNGTRVEMSLRPDELEHA